MKEEATYRPHNTGHDYYEPGIYLITLVTRGRERLFGRLNDDIKSPGVVLTATGEAVMEEWNKISSFEEKKGRKVITMNAICMPDHFHGVIEVKERMDKSLGQVIWGFKVACTKRWRAIVQPTTAEQTALLALRQPSLDVGLKPDLHRMSKKQRAEYYALCGRAEQPLFDDNYDDTICLDEVHKERMIRYVDDNPRRAVIRRARPDFMRRCLHVVIDGQDYAAFGNLFLLRWARKVQVFCHRKARYGMLTEVERKAAGINYKALPEMVTSVDYANTEAFGKEREQWIALIMAGQTVIVTPGISQGERRMKDMCLDEGFPLIHLQKEPIGRYWKPEARRFEACARGALLILAPWRADEMGDVNGIPQNTDYAIFHNMNNLAAQICSFNGEARIIHDNG